MRTGVVYLGVWTLIGCCGALADRACGQRPVVPGTGQVIVGVGDDFEDEAWGYRFNGAKSSKNLDEQVRSPAGEATNGRWYEGVKRGQPDVIERIETPPDGLEGSHGSLLLQSLVTGVPNRPSHRLQQDDFICNVHYRLGRPIPASREPNFVVRVYLPPVDQWEDRTGCHFAIRAALDTTARNRSTGIFSAAGSTEAETYWPGIFIEFESQDGRRRQDDYAYLRVRANSRGGDYKSRQITVTGWWTFGMSVTGDGRVHYYASPGVDDLTEEDWLASEFPYGYRCEQFKTFFFNVCNGDDGRTWSTPWVIDDAEMYVAN